MVLLIGWGLSLRPEIRGDLMDGRIEADENSDGILDFYSLPRNPIECPAVLNIKILPPPNYFLPGLAGNFSLKPSESEGVPG
jgi:hypothetical protein